MDVKSRWNGMRSPTSWELFMNILALPSQSQCYAIFPTSPAHLKLTLTMESYSSVMVVAASILFWNPLVVLLCILPWANTIHVLSPTGAGL